MVRRDELMRRRINTMAAGRASQRAMGTRDYPEGTSNTAAIDDGCRDGTGKITMPTWFNLCGSGPGGEIDGAAHCDLPTVLSTRVVRGGQTSGPRTMR